MTFCANPNRRCEVFLSLANNIYLKLDESVSWSEFLFLNKLRLKSMVSSSRILYQKNCATDVGFDVIKKRNRSSQTGPGLPPFS